MIERIAELVNDKNPGNLRHSRRERSRRDADRGGAATGRYPQVVLNNLFKLTPLKSNCAHMLALVNGEPILLTLRRMLDVFLAFRVETIERRTRYLLRKAEERITSFSAFCSPLISSIRSSL